MDKSFFVKVLSFCTPLLVLFFFLPSPVHATTSGSNSPGTMADDATVGTVTWSSTDNAKVSDDAYSTNVITDGEGGGATTHYLKATNFGFSIPTGATINGILVEFEAKTAAVSATWSNVRIVKGGTISATTKASASLVITTTEAYSSVPTSDAETDLWGETWTAEDINSSTFGVVGSIKTA
ncbi:MAG: hypothetical protein Q7S05_02135 [bacterium]|nr:hypothetical protein [bacterium]